MKSGLWRNKYCVDIDYRLTDFISHRNGGYEAKAVYIRRDWGSGPRILSWANKDGVVTLDPETIIISPDRVGDWMRLDS